MSKVSGHVSTQNGSQICPSTLYGRFFGPCPLDMGLSNPSFSLRCMYVPNITLEIDGLISINLNFELFIITCLLPFDFNKLFEKSIIYCICCQASCKSMLLEMMGPTYHFPSMGIYFSVIENTNPFNKGPNNHH